VTAKPSALPSAWPFNQLSTLRCLQSVRITGARLAPRCTDLLLADLARCPSLQRLELSLSGSCLDCSSSISSGIAALGNSSSLTHLTLGVVGGGGRQLGLQAALALASLPFSWELDGWAHLPFGCSAAPALEDALLATERLQVWSPHTLVPRVHALAASMRSLTSLILPGLALDWNGLEGWQLLCSLPQLQHLHLHSADFCRVMDHRQVHSMPALEPLQAAPQLTSLVLERGCTADLLGWLVPSLRQLTCRPQQFWPLLLWLRGHGQLQRLQVEVAAEPLAGPEGGAAAAQLLAQEYITPSFEPLPQLQQLHASGLAPLNCDLLLQHLARCPQLQSLVLRLRPGAAQALSGRRGSSTGSRPVWPDCGTPFTASHVKYLQKQGVIEAISWPPQQQQQRLLLQSPQPRPQARGWQWAAGGPSWRAGPALLGAAAAAAAAQPGRALAGRWVALSGSVQRWCRSCALAPVAC
jgi:hypothetical protein